jgi:hypothetical protein
MLSRDNICDPAEIIANGWPGAPHCAPDYGAAPGLNLASSNSRIHTAAKRTMGPLVAGRKRLCSFVFPKRRPSTRISGKRTWNLHKSAAREERGCGRRIRLCDSRAQENAQQPTGYARVVERSLACGKLMLHRVRFGPRMCAGRILTNG